MDPHMSQDSQKLQNLNHVSITILDDKSSLQCTDEIRLDEKANSFSKAYPLKKAVNQFITKFTTKPYLWTKT